jgi:hypothetical protein
VAVVKNAEVIFCIFLACGAAFNAQDLHKIIIFSKTYWHNTEQI